MADRKDWPYGKSVVDGEVRYLSPSAMSTADPNSEGCPRKWWYQALRGIRSPQTKAQTRGVDIHSEVERYMKTGDRSLSSLTLSGLHMVPDPGADLGIELDIAGGALETAPVRASGIPIVGYIDLVHARGTNKGGVNIEETQDPPNTIEVMDWKTTSDSKWVKSAKEMASTIQMTTYGKWVLTTEPRVEHVRLSHGYFVERGGPSRKVSLLVLPEHIERNWEHTEGVARLIGDAAREPDPDRVPANTRVCDRFGGCPAKEICKARMHVALESFVGVTMADKLLGRQQETPTMGLFDKMKAAQSAGLVAATTTPTETSVTIGSLGGLLGAPAAQAPAPDPAIAAAAERAKLEAEEITLRAATQLRAAADKLGPILAKLEGYAASNAEVGFPTFAGEAAKAYFVCKNKVQDCDPVVGNGRLMGAKVSTIDEAEDIVKQLDAYAANGQIKPVATAPGVSPLAALGGLLSPETPAPTQTAVAPPVTQAPQGPPPGVPMPPPAPAQTPAPEPATPPPAEKTKRVAASKKAPEPSGTAFHLFVDSVVDFPGASIQSFHPFLEAACAELSAMSSDLDLRAAGVRGTPTGQLIFAKDDSAMAFGRWEGALGAYLREHEFPAGIYYLDTRGNRTAEIAADALREKCRKTNGIFAWGRR